MTLIDIVATSVVIAFGLVWLLPRIRDMGKVESQVVLASFVLHLLASVATMLVAQVVYQGYVDFASFQRAGELIARELRNDFSHVAPRALLLFFHQDAVINVPLNLEGKGSRATVSMWIIAAFGNVLFLGSVQAIAAACSLFSFAGKLLMVRTFRSYFPNEVRPWAAAAFLLVPSVVFWTSGLIKEAIAVGGLGFAIAGVREVLLLRRPRGVVQLLFGLVVVACIKPYLLIPLGVGTGAWVYSERARGADGRVQIRPMWLLGAMGAALLGVILVGRLFPQFAFDALGEQAAQMQFYGRRAAGGSFYILGDPSESSLVGQLQFAPFALFTALYRPLIIESANLQIFANSLETTAVLVVSVVVFARRGWRWIASTLVSNPALAFATAFAIPLALGVGLVSNNLGTLSRYRSPAVPFVVLALVALYQAHSTRRKAAITAAPPRTTPAATAPALRTSGRRAARSA